MSEQSTILKMVDICKSFPGVNALEDVSLELKKGEVLGLIGENGAGKSTLMKILTGAYEMDSGSIEVDGEHYTKFDIDTSQRLGIGMIYQEINLIPRMSVLENIFVGNEAKNGIFLNKRKMYQEGQKILETMGVSLNLNAIVGNLTVAYQQLVEIAKCVSKNPKILIMDEPTGPLTEEEVQLLFKLIRRLKEQGISIIYISHRLEELFEICDKIVVLRDGKNVTDYAVQDTDKARLIKDMVGREISNVCPRVTVESGEVVLEAKDLITDKLDHVSFKARKGEILGFGGLVGAGRTETVRAIFGADELYSGEILDGKGNKIEIRTPKDAIKNGIVLVPEDRKRHGLILHMSVKDNLAFPNMDMFRSGAFLDDKKIKNSVAEYIDRLEIKTPNDKKIVRELSGGNQQKIVVAKWLMRNADIIMFDEPTRGIDVGAKYEIYMLMNELKKAGKAIIMVSSDMQELIGMSDRIIVMCEGRVTGELSKEEITQERILWFASQTEAAV